MKREMWVLVVACAACGKVSNKPVDAPAGPMDSPKPIDTAIDSPPTPRCNPASPFGTPVALAIDTAMSEEAPYLSPDELTLYFSSTRTGTLGGYDIFMATRASRDVDFSNVTPVMGVNTTASERGPIVSADGLTMYAQTGTSPNYEISIATRSSTSADFSAFSVAANINSTADDGASWIMPNGSALYIGSTRTGGAGATDIYRAPKSGSGFGTPLPVVGDMLNTAANESGAIVTADELTIYFTSDRAGGLGSYDVYMATRASTADGFGAPVNLQTVNSAGIDQPAWISADNCVLYLTVGPCCTYDLMVATRGM